MPRETDPVDETVIAVVARAADLPLGEGRARVIAKPLAAWLKDAYELNRKMSQPEYLDILPATTFNQRAR